MMIEDENGVGKFQVDMDDEVRWIMGRPCFAFIGMANTLRMSGLDIKHRAEDEQAACIHWMLNLYLLHGEGWREMAGRFLKQFHPAKSVTIDEE